MNQGGNVVVRNFHIKVADFAQRITVDGQVRENGFETIVEKGQTVTLAVVLPSNMSGGTCLWSTGATSTTLTIDDIQESGVYTAEYSCGEQSVSAAFTVFVRETASRKLDAGNYLVRHVKTNTFLTNLGDGTVGLAEDLTADGKYSGSQVWYLNSTSLKRTNVVSLADSTHLNANGVLVEKAFTPFAFFGAVGTLRFAIQVKAKSAFWTVGEDGALVFDGPADFDEYEFEIVPVEDFVPSGIDVITGDSKRIARIDYYTLDGRRLASQQKGLCIRRLHFTDGTSRSEKWLLR
jgi:hypothetical protein